MANLDWSQCPAVESIPGKVSGAWVFKDTRLPVATVIENLEDLSVEEVMEQFDATREQITGLGICGAEPQGVGSYTDSPSRRCSFSLTTEHHEALFARFQGIQSLRLMQRAGIGLIMVHC